MGSFNTVVSESFKMTNTTGYRRGTRYMFSQKFRKHGNPAVTTFQHVYKRGQIVDVKANASQQKGMPHKYYHGKTGVIYNVSKTAVGVLLNKKHRGRIIQKKVNLKVEHIKHSTCRIDFLDRVKQNDIRKKAARAEGKTVITKRLPQAPLAPHTIRAQNFESETTV